MLQPIRAYLLRRVARAANNRRQWNVAIAHYEALRLTGSARPSDIIRHAKALEEAGHKDAAERAFRDNVALFPLEPNVHRQLALYLLRVQQPETAILAFARAQALAPDDEVIASDLAGLAAKGDHLPALAVAGFYAAPAPIPDRRSPIKRWMARRAARSAKAHRQAGDWPSALAAQTAVITNNPHNASAHIRLAHVLRALGKSKEAEIAYWRGVALAPRGADSYLQLGHGLKQSRGPQAALPAYVIARQLKPSLVEAGAAIKEGGLSDQDAVSYADALTNANPQAILAADVAAVGSADESAIKRRETPERPRSIFIDVRAAAIAGDIGRVLGASQ